MAKVGYSYPPAVPPKPILSRRGLVATVLISCCALWVVIRTSWDNVSPSFVKHSSNPGANKFPSSSKSGSDTFDWKELYPSEKLNWVDCYDGFKCTRLEVPLDYSKPHEEKAAIALLKIPSKYEMGDPRWRGPILYNPGGPGGSGVQKIRTSGRDFAKIIGEEYDHIGFDPRGIGETTPSFTLFHTPAERTIWNTNLPVSLNISDPLSLSSWMGYSALHGTLATTDDRPSSWVGKYVSTAIVCRDMLSITRAHGREKVLYWGFSYGTVLGVTFASMFPDKIERMIIDGVGDSYDYYEGRWSSNLVNTDQAYANVLSACAASPSCPLHTPNSSLASLQKRVDSILDVLRENPLPVIIPGGSGVAPGAEGENYGLLTFTLARLALFVGLYKPRRDLIPWFRALVAVSNGDGKEMYELSQRKEALFRCDCSSSSSRGGGIDNEMEIAAAIACSDAVPLTGGKEEVREIQERLNRDSSFGEFWITNAICSGWKIRSVERFPGALEGNTSHPILLIGNTADPVTPLEAAKRMSTYFPGSVVLTQNSTGHCSPSSPSTCTAKYIREYFRSGTLPEAGTVCQVDYPMFTEPDNSPEMMGDREEREFRETVRKLSREFDVPLFGTGGRR